MSDFLKLLEDKGHNLRPVPDNAVPVVVGGNMAGTYQKELMRDAPLPPYNTLPENIKKVLDQVKSYDFEEKLNFVNSFVNDQIEYAAEGSSQDFSTKSTWIDTLKSSIGDCDDYTHVKAAMLHYAGVDDDRMHLVGAKIQYAYDNGRVTEPEDHAALIVEDNNNYYVLDDVVKDVLKIDTNAPNLKTDSGNGPYSEENGAATMHLESVYVVGNLSESADQQKFYIQEKGADASCYQNVQKPGQEAPESDPYFFNPKCNF